jgi:hypothetical protein
MGWVSQTLALVRARFGALVATAALALLPANLLGAGAVRFGAGLLGGVDIAPANHTQQVQEKQHDLRDQGFPPAEGVALAHDALEGEAPAGGRSLGAAIPLALSAAVGLAILLIGLALAHAALVPVVLGTARRPSEAWAAVAARMGALLVTGVQGALLIALGTVLLVLPGIAAMMAFAFAVPAVVIEGLSGSAALDRSWRLIRGRCWAVLALWMLLAALTAASIAIAAIMPAGAWRLFGGSLVRTLIYPLPLAGFIVLYAEARRAETRSVHAADLGARVVVRQD